MIARVPLFASLDEEAVAEVGNRLRPVVALPDEKIIATGGKPDSMYFIAAGEVTVVRQGSRIVLKEGDFFGEQGLLGNRPRNADVISDGYCHLLMLHRRDFDRMLASGPRCGPRSRRSRRAGRPRRRRRSSRAMPRKMHLAQFLVHGPTYHSLAMWRHPEDRGGRIRLDAAGALPAHRARLRARPVRHGVLRRPQLHLRHLPPFARARAALRRPSAGA